MKNEKICCICEETLRRLLLVFNPPADQGGLEQALRAASRALIEFSNQLPSPDSVLSELVDEFRGLSGALRDHKPVLYRRLTNYPAWRLLLTLTERTNSFVLAAIGAEIACCFVDGKAMTRSRADALRVASGAGAAGRDHLLVAQLLLTGERRFSKGEALSAQATQDERLRAHFRAQFHYRGEHQQQARGSHRTLSASVFRAAMAGLRERVEAGNPVATLQAVSLCSGIGLELTRTLPLAGCTTQDWAAALDLELGVILLDVAVVAPGLRKTSSASSVPASSILVRPLPAFLHTALQLRSKVIPEAQSLDELLGQPETAESALIDDAAHPERLRPSLARAQNTVEGFAVRELGIDRPTAAYLSGRFESVSNAKPHYALISRSTIWEGATELFDSVGWGAPVPLAAGLPCGPVAIPRDLIIQEWVAWMAHQVKISAPGRNTGVERLRVHHNNYCCFAASLVACCLALRPAAQLPLVADMELQSLTVGVLDKRSPSAWAPDGRSAGPHPTPFPLTARYQIDLYRKHCGALARRLRRFEACEAQRRAFEHIAVGDGVPLFVLFDADGTLHALGTRDLTAWWPAHLGLTDNWWRSFWQTRLAEAGVPSRAIDMLMRHVSAGERPLSSDRGDNPLVHAQAVVEAMGTELIRLGIAPLRGLAR